MKIKIAVVQFKIAQLDPQKNYQRLEQFVKKAQAKKAQIVVFPEDCISGSIEDCATGEKNGFKKWLDTDGQTKKFFQGLAVKYNIDIVSGSNTELVGKKIFNTTYYIDSQGKILGQYRKNHLYKTERSFITAGNKTSVFKTAWGKVGLAICWDITFADIFKKMSKAGVKMIFCPSYWWRGISEDAYTLNRRYQEKAIDALCLTRAFETKSVFVYANAAGKAVYKNKTSDVLIGHSQITMPILGVVKKLNHNWESMFIQEVDLGLLDKAKKIFHNKKRG
ncbi:MAG: carbon-nitrogen hydrolase family protein [Patescibacteria group bacterium]|jgi:predicted amidohydrolase